jgi:hypothetical protein
MNKEQQELVDAAYKAFEKWYNEHSGKEDYTGYFVPDKEEFIRLIKTDDLFSEKWGLTIEERDLSLEERQNLYFKLNPEFRLVHEDMDKHMDKHNIPTKLITITYNDKTIKSYE